MTQFYIELDTPENFDLVTKQSAVCVVDLYTQWCPPCKQLSVRLEKAVTENSDLNQFVSNDLNNLKDKLTFLKVDAEAFPDIAEYFKLSSIPLIHFYKDGVLCKEKVVGANLNGILNIVTALTDDMVAKASSKSTDVTN